MRLHGKGLGFRRRLGVTTRTIIGGLSVLLIIAAVGCDDKSQPTGPTTARESPGTDVQTQQVATPTTTPTPQLPGSITPVPVSKSYRLDLGAGVVVAFVEGLSPEQPDKVAYVTHVPSGSQAVLDRDGQIIDRHDGRGDGPGRLDAVLEDGAEMDRILKGLKSDEDVRPRETVIDWVPLIQFGGIHYLARWRLAGQNTSRGRSRPDCRRPGTRVLPDRLQGRWLRRGPLPLPGRRLHLLGPGHAGICGQGLCTGVPGSRP